MITREQVADLREGDVVELGFASGTVIRGPLTENRHTSGELMISDAGWTVRDEDGAMGYGLERYAETLTIVSRAPCPLYVNHPRTEPVPGDVVRDADSDDASTWMADADGTWLTIPGAWVPGNGMPTRLRLLVDGETGMTVPSEPRPDVSKNDPTPEWANANPGCAASHTPFLCTREPGHPGQHVAGTGVGNPVAAVWS